MKRILFVLSVIMLPVLIHAQNRFTELASKYDNLEKVVNVSFQKPSLNVMSSMEGVDSDVKSFLDKCSGVDGVAVVGKEICNVKKGILALLSEEDILQELMVISEGDKKVSLFLNQEAEKISELYMLAEEQETLVAICVIGDFTIDDVTKVIKQMKLDEIGMNYLDILGEK